MVFVYMKSLNKIIVILFFKSPPLLYAIFGCKFIEHKIDLVWSKHRHMIIINISTGEKGLGHVMHYNIFTAHRFCVTNQNFTTW